MLPNSERDCPAMWSKRRSQPEIAAGDRVFVWRSSRFFRAVGLSEVTAVADGPDPTTVTATLKTVEKLWHTVPRGGDAHEVPSYAVFNKAEAGQMEILTADECQLLCKHLAHSNSCLGTLGWFDGSSEVASKADSAFDPAQMEDARSRVLREIVQRQGQAEFREALLAAYGGRCCVSGCEVEPLLEAAHIVPYQGPATNHTQNGLLLRADLHSLFDLGLLTVDPETLIVRIHPSITEPDYTRLDGVSLKLPTDRSSGPSTEALHLRTRLPVMPHEPKRRGA